MSETAKTKAVSLVGMMGAGKSTVGALLAKHLGWRYYDNDTEIEVAANMSVPQMFKTRGQEAFREIEAESIAGALAGRRQLVLSVGGGAVLRADTRDKLRHDTYVVWLKAPVEVLIDRVIDDSGSRPMIADDPSESMRRIYVEREPLYRDLADFTIEDSSAPPDLIVEQIVEALK